MELTQANLMKPLLEAGVHFGHQTKHWNPKMNPYIYGVKNDIHIVNLQLTANAIMKTCEFLKKVVSEGGYIIFVGTKRQAQEIIKSEAQRCGMFYVDHRWLGGCLTNFKTVRKGVGRLEELEKMKENGIFDKLSKKEVSQLTKEMNKLRKNLEGIRNMEHLPQALLIVDSKKENIAVSEANRLGVPVVALVDTNCDPTKINYIIPGNDDAIKSIKLIVSILADVIKEGRDQFLVGKEKESALEGKRLEGEVAVSEEEIEVLLTKEDVRLEEEARAKEKLATRKTKPTKPTKPRSKKL